MFFSSDKAFHALLKLNVIFKYCPPPTLVRLWSGLSGGRRKRTREVEREEVEK